MISVKYRYFYFVFIELFIFVVFTKIFHLSFQMYKVGISLGDLKILVLIKGGVHF